MRDYKKLALLALTLAVLMPVTAEAGHVTTVGLGTAGSFAILSGQGVTNTGPSVIRGDIGSHPNPAVTGFPPGSVQNGTINPSYTASAKDALVTAYNDAFGRTPITIPTDLAGQVLTHGVYSSQDGTFTNTGTLTLDADNDPSAVWIFKTATTLITGSGSTVNLVRGASHCNIFWQVGSSATLGTSSTLSGTILALTSITLTTNATLNGRALARNGSVTLDSNTIDATPCLTTPPSPSDGTTTSVTPVSQTQTPSVTPQTQTPSVTTVPRTNTTGPTLPVTGAPLPTLPNMAVALCFILFGLFYNWLGRSPAKLAVTMRGYEPRRRANRRR